MIETPSLRIEEESNVEKMGLYERNMIQMEILKLLGFERSNTADHKEGREWMFEHREEISKFIDNESSEAQKEVRRLAQEERFVEAAEIVVEVLGLER